jgi:phosphatidylglycerol:prolipoprotein diacylglycerol transferase
MHHWYTYPHFNPIAFSIGPVKVHWYGIAYLIGFILVYLWLSRPAGRRRLGLTKEQIQDFLFYALIGVLVGGRAFFVINDIISKHDASYYLSNPINFIAIWKGGMAFHGGLAGVIVAILLFLRKHRGLKFTVFSDEVVMMLPVAITLVRIVNFINDELWGDVCHPDRPWCLQFPAAPDQGTLYRHPSQLYEAILDILTLPVLLLIYRMKPKDGVVAWSWFMIYGITRSIAEMWRQADFTWMGMTGGQLYALPMIVIGLVGILYCARRPGPRTEVAPSAAPAPPPGATPSAPS